MNFGKDYLREESLAIGNQRRTEGVMPVGSGRQREVGSPGSSLGPVGTLADGVDMSEILHEEAVLKELKALSDRYRSETQERARAYADSAVQGEDFDSDDELLEEAKRSLDGLYADKKEKLSADREEKLNSYNQNKEKEYSARQSARNRLLSKYTEAWENNLDNMSRQGLSHSTIADLSGEKILSDYRDALSESNRYYNARIKGYEEKISRLNASYESALKNYEITYAIELEKKLDTLKSKRDKLIDSYQKTYEGEVKQAYRDYLDRENAENARYEEEYGDYTGEKKKSYQERYDYLIGALSGKSKGRIASFLTNHEEDLKKYLGLYYDKLIKEVG